MNREFSDGSLFSVAGISHKSKNVSGRNSITDCEIRLIRGKVRIIKKRHRIQNGFQFGNRLEEASLSVR